MILTWKQNFKCIYKILSPDSEFQKCWNDIFFSPKLKNFLADILLKTVLNKQKMESNSLLHNLIYDAQPKNSTVYPI